MNYEQVAHPVRISASASNSWKLICCHGYLVTANSTFDGPPRNPIRQLISMMPLSRRKGESGGVDFMSSLNSLAPDSHISCRASLWMTRTLTAPSIYDHGPQLVFDCRKLVR